MSAFQAEGKSSSLFTRFEKKEVVVMNRYSRFIDKVKEEDKSKVNKLMSMLHKMSGRSRESLSQQLDEALSKNKTKMEEK